MKINEEIALVIVFIYGSQNYADLVKNLHAEFRNGLRKFTSFITEFRNPRC